MSQKKQELIGFEHSGIGTVLLHHRLAVPLNQREYSWEDEHVTELFQDLSNAIADGIYFLGTIVLTGGEGDVPEVTDGQQRLATTTILLAAIRDHLFRAGDRKRAGTIEREYLQTSDLDTTEDVPKLKLNVDDNEFFTKFVVASPDSADRNIAPVKESHIRIKAACAIAAKHVQSILEPHKEAFHTARLLEWIKFIKSGAQVIVLRVPDDLNAFIMFETLNDRGLEASQADLLKNYLLKHAGTARIREAQQKWAKMLGVLESLGHGGITVTYLHHLLITKHGPTKEREVLTKVKNTVNSGALALEFLDDLSESANDYAALFNSDHKKWNAYGTSTRKHIATINRDLRVEQIRPLMFSVAKHFAIKEARLAFRLFVFWSVRFLVVGGRGGLLDRNYAIAAQLIGKKKIKTAQELEKNLSEIIPTDALFEAAFAEARVSQSHLARYYLRAMEQKRKGQAEPEFVPTEDENVINLEHILPENLDEKAWPNIDKETAGAYCKRIGNLAIFQAKKNSIIGNSSFADKKQLLKDSAFLLTSDIARHTAWGILEINERQKALAKLAVQTWPTGI
jgi:hypothetical protein